jgi:outer membrane protein assembly factor BamB
MSNHLGEKQLIGYIHQTLTDAEREEIDQHLAECAQCRAHLDDHEYLQRRIQYELATNLRKASVSSRKSFAAIAPRLKRGRRLATMQIAVERLSVAGALAAIFVLVYGLIAGPLHVDQPPVDVSAPTGAMFRGNPQRTGAYDTKPVPGLGEPVWEFQAEGSIYTSASATDGMIYIVSLDGHVYGLESQTGQEKWMVSIGLMSFSSPTFADGVLYVGISNQLYALDGRTGEQLWKHDLYWTDSSPAIADGMVYIGNDTGHFYALDSRTGQEVWEFETDGKIVSSPAVADGRVYFGSGDGYLYALDSRTGQPVWQYGTAGAVDSSPAVAEGTVYFSSYDGYLYALDSRTGQEKWKFSIGKDLLVSPAVAEGTVYFDDMQGSFYALDSRTGQEVWKCKCWTSSPLAVAGGVVYFTSYDGHLYAVDAKTGQDLWKFKAKGVMEMSSPIVADGMVYFGSENGTFYAVK